MVQFKSDVFDKKNNLFFTIQECNTVSFKANYETAMPKLLENVRNRSFALSAMVKEEVAFAAFRSQMKKEETSAQAECIPSVSSGKEEPLPSSTGKAESPPSSSHHVNSEMLHSNFKSEVESPQHNDQGSEGRAPTVAKLET